MEERWAIMIIIGHQIQDRQRVLVANLCTYFVGNHHVLPFGLGPISRVFQDQVKLAVRQPLFHQLQHFSAWWIPVVPWQL